ncbi:MAG TPA: penicillin-binding protein 1A [Rhizomicrobium sp.]|jgi:penicillin-binding protein 1A|nr:penicillin-binding protein 1A [Rhizomicrobium sp.]
MQNFFSRLLKWLGLAAAALVVVVIGFCAFWVVTLMRDLPSVQTLQDYAPPITTRVYAGNGTVLGEYAHERRIFVPASYIPKLVKQAFTSAEDRNFYSHPGIDPSGILRAAIKDVGLVLQGRRPQGASTITQQVARGFLLNSDLKMARKVREAILAIRIDATYPKEKVLELYLNEINLGQNSYGVAAAALNYFGKSLDELDISEVAFLAALPKSPSHYDPRFHHDAAIDRRNWVIGQMAENGYITDDQAKAARAEPLITQTRALGSQAADVDYYVEEVRRLLYKQYGDKALYDGGLQVRASLDTRLQNYAVGALRSGLVRYDRRHGWRGAKMHVDLANWKDGLAKLASDPNHQSGIDTWRVAAALDYDGKNVRIGFPDGSTGVIPYDGYKWARHELPGQVWGPTPTGPQDVIKAGDAFFVEQLPVPAKKGEFGLRQVPEVNGAIVVMDPHTGRVLAMSGGFSYASSQFDRAMQAERQPGSSFKPFVYATALDMGYTPVSKVLDAPFEMDMGPGQGIWRPENFEKGEFLGDTTLRRGLELSRNVMTVRLAYTIGMNNVVKLPIRFGVYDKLPPLLANSLGSYETTLMRMVTGYSEFVNGGKKISASLIDRIQDRNGMTIWRHDNRKCEGCNDANWHGQEEPLLPDTREQIIDPRTAYQIVSMLQGVVQRGTAAYSVGAQINKPLAGKTGTSQDAQSTWFIGFSPDLACGVYVGFDNPRTLGPKEQGATVAAPIFRDFMKDALADAPPTPFRVAPGIEEVPVDWKSGNPVPPGTPGAIMEAFKAGTAPGEANAPGASVDDVGAAPGTASVSQSTTPPASVGEGTGGLY